MRRLFRNIHGETVQNEIQYTLDVLKSHPTAKVYVGSDSQKRRKTIDYAVVIAYRYGTRGAHFIYSKWGIPKKGYGKGDALIEKRLVEEVSTTMAVANRLAENGVNVHQVDFDLNGNPKWKSNKFVQMATGWATALGYKVAIKPDVMVACKAANHLVN